MFYARGHSRRDDDEATPKCASQEAPWAPRTPAMVRQEMKIRCKGLDSDGIQTFRLRNRFRRMTNGGLGVNTNAVNADQPPGLTIADFRNMWREIFPQLSLSEKHWGYTEQVFKEIDADCSGEITWNEIIAYLAESQRMVLAMKAPATALGVVHRVVAISHEEYDDSGSWQYYAQRVYGCLSILVTAVAYAVVVVESLPSHQPPGPSTGNATTTLVGGGANGGSDQLLMGNDTTFTVETCCCAFFLLDFLLFAMSYPMYAAQLRARDVVMLAESRRTSSQSTTLSPRVMGAGGGGIQRMRSRSLTSPLSPTRAAQAYQLPECAMALEHSVVSHTTLNGGSHPQKGHPHHTHRRPSQASDSAVHSGGAPRSAFASGVTPLSPLAVVLGGYKFPTSFNDAGVVGAAERDCGVNGGSGVAGAPDAPGGAPPRRTSGVGETFSAAEGSVADPGDAPSLLSCSGATGWPPGGDPAPTAAPSDSHLTPSRLSSSAVSALTDPNAYTATASVKSSPRGFAAASLQQPTFLAPPPCTTFDPTHASPGLTPRRTSGDVLHAGPTSPAATGAEPLSVPLTTWDVLRGLCSTVSFWLGLVLLVPYAVVHGGGDAADSGVVRLMFLLKSVRVVKLLVLCLPIRGGIGWSSQRGILTKSAGDLAYLTLIVVLVVMIAACFVFFCETHEAHFDDARGEWVRNGDSQYLDAGKRTPFQSIPAAMWWGLVTICTVGYGDDVPHTWGGKLVTVFLMITGLVVVTSLFSTLSMSFSTLNGEREALMARREVCRLFYVGVKEWIGNGAASPTTRGGPSMSPEGFAARARSPVLQPPDFHLRRPSAELPSLSASGHPQPHYVTVDAHELNRKLAAHEAAMVGRIRDVEARLARVEREREELLATLASSGAGPGPPVE